MSGITLNFSDIFVIKGSTFLGFGDALLGMAAPSVAAMQAQASTSLTRLP